jgi:hypothetical protein
MKRLKREKVSILTEAYDEGRRSCPKIQILDKPTEERSLGPSTDEYRRYIFLCFPLHWRYEDLILIDILP